MQKQLHINVHMACYIKAINNLVLLETGEIPELCRNGDEDLL